MLALLFASCHYFFFVPRAVLLELFLRPPPRTNGAAFLPPKLPLRPIFGTTSACVWYIISPRNQNHVVHSGDIYSGPPKNQKHGYCDNLPVLYVIPKRSITDVRRRNYFCRFHRFINTGLIRLPRLPGSTRVDTMNLRIWRTPNRAMRRSLAAREAYLLA
jgi:hypothetical protein